MADSAPALVRELKSVLFPTLGRPTIPNFIFILSPLKVLILQAFQAYELCRCYNWCYIFIINIRIFIELYNLQRTRYKLNFFVFFVLSKRLTLLLPSLSTKPALYKPFFCWVIPAPSSLPFKSFPIISPFQKKKPKYSTKYYTIDKLLCVAFF